MHDLAAVRAARIIRDLESRGLTRRDAFKLLASRDPELARALVRRARDEGEAAPPSSRSGRRVPYHFATAASLVRHERLPMERAVELVREWRPYVDARMRAGRSPESTAQHIARISSQRLSSRPPRSRDPQAARRRLSREERRASAGEERISARGVAFTVCPHPTRLQALMFPKTHYDLRSARAWAEGRRPGTKQRSQPFAVRKIEQTDNWIRVQIVPSSLFQKRSFRNIVLSEKYNVRGIIGCPLVEISGRSTRRGVRGAEVPQAPQRIPGREERRRRVA